MKFLYFHLIYCTIIAFLGYNYWSSTQAFKAFEHVNKQLNVDYELMHSIALKTQNNIDKYYYAYQNEQHKYLFNQGEMATKATGNLIDFIDTNKKEFIQINGGLDTLNNTNLINANSIKTAKLFFTDVKINEIKAKLTDFSKILADSFRNQKLIDYFQLPPLIADTRYWQLIKTLPASGVLAELSCIQNQIKMDEITFLNYQFDQFSYDYNWGFDRFKTIIAPYNGGLTEGETFEADVFIGAISTNSSKNCSIRINGETIEMKQGIAHFRSKNQTLGTKIIKAEALIKNPLTGQTRTTESYFQYQVLSKCSRDCQ